MDAATMAIAVGSSGNSSLGSSSSSSASSSGYGSATTTPTTPGQYEATAAATTPMATIATVAPFYSEALTSLDAQHRQQQQQQQQLQHQYQHQQQQHQQQHQQQQQTHFYHQNYNYGSNMSLDAYNYSAYNYNVPSARYEKLAKYNSNSNTLHSSSSNSSSNSSKPQAAATPFYAQPSQTMTNPYDAYKYKLASQQQSLPVPQQQQHAQQQYHQLGMGMAMNMGVGVGMGMGMSMNMGMTAAQKQQQQQQQLQQQQSQQQQLLPPLEPSYAAIKPSSRYQNMPTSVYGGVGGAVGAVGPGVGSGVATGVGAANGTTVQGNASAYYDKYAMSLYTPNAPLGFGAPAPLYSPPELGAEPAYRKSGNASCHWPVDNGNSPAIYQYGNATNVANGSAVNAANELYYKYDKYGTAAAYQTNLTQPYAGRGIWSGANPVENSSSNGRQSCCTQAYAPQSCYYSRGNGYDTVAPPTAQYVGGSNNNGSHNSSSNTASSLMNHKLHKHPTDLYANYELGPSQRPYAYAQNTPATPSNSQRYVAPMSLGMGMEASVSTAYYNDLSPLDGYGQQVALSTHRNQPPLEYQYRKRALPTPAMAPNNCYLGNLETHVDQFGSGYATPSPTTLKSSSNSSNIRDFLASWNDDEEEVTAPQAVAVVAPTPAPTVVNSSFMYETLAPAGPVATAVLDAQVSELNLPDIIIDHHEKAVGNLAPNVPHVEDSFGSFDVEKELDELRLKKGTGDQVTGDNDALAEILREPEVAPPPQLPQQETSPPTPLTSPNPAGTEPQTSIEFDQQTSNNSNESTFEKEYETFIHSELSAPVDTELREHDKFKFYKRKRKTTEPSSFQEVELVAPVESIPKSPVVKSSARSSRKLLARRRRNRLKMLQILEFESPKIKHRYYFLTLKLLHRRFAQSQGREQRLKRMRRQLALRKERHLPLIKRQSAMQYAQEQQGEQEQQGKLANPSSPKGSSGSAIEPQAKVKTESSSGRETVIKSVSAVREKLDKPEESTELCIPVPEAEEHSSDSNHSRSLKSVELLGSFKGFDDVENTNLSPRAKLRVEESEEKVEKEGQEEQEEEPKELGKVAAKQLEIQRWLSNSMEEQCLSKTQAETVICLSSGSSSASSSSSSSSSGSSSSDSDSNSSSSSSGEENKDGASSSSSSSEASEFNELAALQKELSQQPEQVSKSNSDVPAETLTIPEDTPEKVSNKDIAKLKQILESDGDEELPPSPRPERVQCSSVPKLSDLSKIALNSSLKLSDCPTEGLNPLEAPPRELSVEEALAEMYQQIGVASDPEDCEVEAVARKDMEESTAGQDVLINLAEIFDNNSSDLYVVQCDLNENILGVVNGEQNELQQQQQLIELLAQPEIETIPVEAPEIHHEEIVPPEKCKIRERRRQLLKYLHAKYVQSHIGRYYHAQRVLKKYKRIPCKSKSSNSLSLKFKH